MFIVIITIFILRVTVSAIDIHVYYVYDFWYPLYVCVCSCVYKNRTGSVENWTISKVSVELSATFSSHFTTILWL